MATAAAAAQPTTVLRVAAVWGTTVVALRSLGMGESFMLGDAEGAVLPIPDGLDMSSTPVHASQGAWEIDARGAVTGVLKLRGRDEDVASFARSGAAFPIVPGDYGLLQYGQFGIFFQYSQAAQPIGNYWAPELLVALALFSSGVLHVGILGLVRALMTPPPIAKPLELTNPDEYAARFGLRRAIVEEPPPQAGNKPGGSGVKNPGARDKKPQGGGRKVAGAEGKLGLNGSKDKTEIPGEIKPARNYGGISEVLQSETGEQIKQTLSTINSVSEALAMNSQQITIGSGPGTSLKGGGHGGGGTGAGVIFGSGTMDTGWGAGRGGGYGRGTGGPGGPGEGGYGNGGRGGGTGRGNGTGGGGARIGINAGAPTAHGGLSPEQIRRVVMAHQGALRACYDMELGRNPNLRGGVTMTWNIDPSGSVASAGVAGSTIHNARVEGCVLRQVKSWHFPSSESATNVAAYPFKFGIGG
jgi:hypothetical protein